ncbi:alpha/beta hydrolase [Kocuria sp. LUK]|uniref:alpha/beta fold hydrolase n=1 Tax=Kocuria sp. LUK TaxID=2897828 RepID=UPI001E64ABD0|nr:alpha/beta hydrolase [Kocuria sp. LUK]MCD1143764.1 alpha/beta hydrolase [Kocuria sp. LUK]
MPTSAPPTARARELVLDGRRVRYWCHGPDDDALPPLLLVHGFRGDHHGLELLARRLGPRRRVVVPDLPGFGRSEPLPRRPHDVPAYTAFLHRFLAALPGGRPAAAVLGHSFGSVLAAHLAAEHPADLERLVLVNPICEPALEGPRAVLSRLTAAYYRLGRALPEPLGRALLSGRAVTDAMSALMTVSPDPAVRRWVREQHRTHFSSFADRDVVLEAYTASTTGTVAQVAERLTVPVLLVAGAEDELGSVAAQRRMAARIPRARLTVLADVGHLIHYEAPEVTAALVRDFLGPAGAGGRP